MPQYIYDGDEFMYNHCMNCYKDMSNSASSLCFDCEDEVLELFTELAEEIRN